MINKLNVFSENTYVVAEEWNANFKVLSQSNKNCEEAINDANEQLAFPNGDLSGVYAAVRSKINSSEISGNLVRIAPQNEYYKTLSSNENLLIHIPENFNSEARIVLKLTEQRDLEFIQLDGDFSGNKTILYDKSGVFTAGIYYVLVYAVQSEAFAKIIWTRS